MSHVGCVIGAAVQFDVGRELVRRACLLVLISIASVARSHERLGEAKAAVLRVVCVAECSNECVAENPLGFTEATECENAQNAAVSRCSASLAWL